MRSAALAVAASLVVLPGCYHFRVSATNAPPADELQSSRKWSFLWGAIQSRDSKPDCKGNGVSEVTATTTGLDLLLSLVTLGTVVPSHLAWRCAKDRVRDEGDFSGTAAARPPPEEGHVSRQPIGVGGRHAE